MKIMISGHGERKANANFLSLPKNMAVNFFVADGDILSNDQSVTPNAWAIYNDWPNINTPVTRRVTGQISDYYCWSMDDAVDGSGTTDASGIFDESKTKIQGLPSSPSVLLLSTIILNLKKTYPTEQVDIYWVCCRSIG